jgi:hypothetical protein
MGLETARDTFRRYRVIREHEREYVDWPDPIDSHEPRLQGAEL